MAKKSIQKKKKITLLTMTLLFLLALIVLTAAATISSYYQTIHPKPAVETPKTEMKKIPDDVKKSLADTPTPSLLASIRVPILMYHYVEYVQDKKDTIRESLNVNPDVFESQMVTLKNAGYTFMTAKELGDVLDGKMKLPSQPILLTFDDGHWDFDTVVLPILKKYNIHATAYIISGFIGGSDFMSQTQLQDVVNSGLIDVGDHTIHHYALKGLPFQLVTTEVTQSKADLEKQYHIHIVSFAYPNGSFDLQAINAVKSAGYTTAVSTIPGIIQSNTNRYFLYRLRPGYRTGQALVNWLQQNAFQAY